METEPEKVRIEIQHCQSVIADEKVIAEELIPTFENASAEEQKEFLRLLVREMRVNHLGPETDTLPDGRSAFVAKMRTSYFLVNTSLFANSLMSEPTEKVERRSC